MVSAMGAAIGAPEVVAVGEVMATLTAAEPGPFAVGAGMRLSFAGAEATVAIGVSRLGHGAAWVGRLGQDALGDMIHSGLQGEGVDVSAVVRDAERPTGLMLRERRTADRVRIAYYRRDLAGANLAPADVPDGLIRGARILHLSGVTPALGPSAAESVGHAVAVARESGVAVSFDVNYRALLWPAEEAAPVLRLLARSADVLFTGSAEAAVLCGSDESDPERLANEVHRLGSAEVVLKLGADGALAVSDRGRAHVAAPSVTVVDPLGAGDAFVAGYLAGMLEGVDLVGRLRRACTCGAFAVSVPGDWEGLARAGELHLLDAADVLR